MCFFLDAFLKYTCYCIFYDHVSGNMHKLKVNFYDYMIKHEHACFIMLHNEACDCSLIACTCIIVAFVLLICRSGYVVPPLPCCRLLLVLQYMVFRFNEPVQQLVQQV